jgi:predicted nuclease of predicted toxin-antitoxin system
VIRLLIDEHLSPRLVGRLAERGVYARHLAHVGLAGATDPEVWRYAFANDFAVVTINARDFLRLAKGMPLHPGLIVLRESGLTRSEQWAWLAPVVRHLLETEEPLINRVIEIWSVGHFDARDLPADP